MKDMECFPALHCHSPSFLSIQASLLKHEWIALCCLT